MKMIMLILVLIVLWAISWQVASVTVIPVKSIIVSTASEVRYVSSAKPDTTSSMEFVLFTKITVAQKDALLVQKPLEKKVNPRLILVQPASMD